MASRASEGSFLPPRPNCSMFLLLEAHTQSSSAHFGSLAVCFLLSAAAAPTLILAPAKIAGVRGDVTVMSKAAGFLGPSPTLAHQLGECDPVLE